MERIIVPARTGSLEQVTAFVDEKLESHGCSMTVQMQVELAVEEIFINIASYAYAPGEGEAEVRCEVAGDRVVVQFLDSGTPYDPLSRGEADISKEALLSRVGGLGIHLVKKTMDDVQYAYEDGKNILTIQKRLS